MATTPRRHHYLPQFYLAGFTASGSRDDFLYVIDQTGPKQWKAKVDQVAVEKDLYAMEGAEDPAGMEKAFSEIESSYARVLAQVLETQDLPNDQGLTDLIEFVGMMVTRVPSEMAKIHDFIDHIGRTFLHEIVRSRDQWEAKIAELKEEDPTCPDISYEAMKEFVESGEYDVRFDQNTVISNMVDSMKILRPHLHSRRWFLASAEDAYLICSDRPVSLDWVAEKPPVWWGPGFGMFGTRVMLPLSKDLLMYGTFEGFQMSNPMPERDVAIVNSQTGGRGRFVYSAHEDFVLYKHDGSVGHTKELIEALGEAKEIDDAT